MNKCPPSSRRVRRPRLAAGAVAALLGTGLLATTTSALAQLEPTATDPAVATAVGGPELTPLVLPVGLVSLRLPLVINLSTDFVGKPINIPIDVYYGLSESLTVGLSHSAGALQPSLPYLLREGLCLSGEENGCAKVYNNVGVDLIYQFMTGVIQLAGHGGLDVHQFDPNFLLALRFGLLAQAPLASNVAIIVDPRLSIGLTERDLNHDELVLPLAVQFWLTPHAKVAARTVLGGSLDHFSDEYYGRLGFFAGFHLTERVEAWVAFDFLNLYGKHSSADYRQLSLGADIAF